MGDEARQLHKIITYNELQVRGKGVGGRQSLEIKKLVQSLM